MVEGGKNEINQKLFYEKGLYNAGAADLEEDEDDEIMNAEQQLFIEQQLANEFMNAAAEDSEEDEDGLMLGGMLPHNQHLPLNQPLDKLGMMAQHPDIGEEPMQMQQVSYKPIPKLKSWIQWFLSLEDHDLYLEIDLDFIADKMNLLGLKSNFSSKSKYKECMKLMLSGKVPNEEDLSSQKFMELNADTSDLYGLIHQRYVVSPTGLAKLYGRYLQGFYGYCPRALCDRQKVIPVGMSDKLRTSRLKVYCPRCEETYLPKYKQVNLDGAHFGQSLAQIFLKQYQKVIILPPKVYYYEPKIFGFRLFGKKGSKYHQPPKGSTRNIEEEEDIEELVKNFKTLYNQQKKQQSR